MAYDFRCFSRVDWSYIEQGFCKHISVFIDTGDSHDKFGYTTIAAIEQVGESFVCYNMGDTRIYIIGNKTFA